MPNEEFIEMNSAAEDTSPPSIAPSTDSCKPCQRRQDAAFWSKWTYLFFNPLLSRASKRLLQPQDYAGIEDADNSVLLSDRIREEWDKDVAKGKRPQNGRLRRVLFRVFGPSYAWAGVAFFCESVVKIGEAYTLALLLEWFQQGSPISANGVNMGFVYAGILSFVVLCHAFLHHVEFFISMRVGMQLRVSLIAVIYRKAMDLTLSHTSSSGYIINMVSNDVQRFEDASPFAHMIWLGPLECLVVLYLVYLQISWAAFAAIGALLLFIPLQSTFATAFRKLRTKTVKFRDERIKSISDMLSGILVVKLYHWELPFISQINRHRDEEMHAISSASNYRAVNESFFFTASAIISLCGFVTFFFIGGTLTPSRVFSTLTYINFLVLDMTNFLPKALQFLSESRISLERIEKFMCLKEIHRQQTPTTTDLPTSLERSHRKCRIMMDHGCFKWEDNPNASVILSDVSFTVENQILAVCGSVGAGKTSLLNAILGEMQLTAGSVVIKSVVDEITPTIAYVNQIPWLMAGSIKENILFGQEYDAVWFDRVIKACALDVDFKNLPFRENTLLGERGINLSGGQRSRVGLARAVYSKADIYLLDDPLSAVDTLVGRHLFNNVLKGLLKDKTIVLVTHQLSFVKDCDMLLLMEVGKVKSFGNVRDLSKEDPHHFMIFADSAITEDESALPSATLKKLDEAIAADFGVLPSKEAEPESMDIGDVSFETYSKFLLEGSKTFYVVGLIFALLAGQAALVISSWWLSKWASTPSPSNEYAYIYIGLVFGTFLISNIRAIAFFQALISSSRHLFRIMMEKVVFSTMSFFNDTPKGRILNRLSKDVNLTDEMLPQTLYDFIQCFLLIVGNIMVSVVVIPFVLILLPFCFIAFYYIRKWYIQTSRQIKRYEAVSRSPVYSSVSETLEGLAVIRAFQAGDQFVHKFLETQNENTRIFFAFLCGSRWLGLRLDGMASLFLIFVVFLSILLKNYLNLTPALIGFAIAYALQLVGLLQWSVRQSTEVENLMVSVERIMAYMELPSEGSVHHPSADAFLPESWPEHGALSLKQLRLRYPGTEADVLRGLTIEIKAGTKVGIIGRTGAGKSSLLQALFRLVEIESDSLYLDGVDITQVSLGTLRSRISIIPQEPFCFKGTLRFNLDPFSKYMDDAIWKALDAVQLGEYVRSMTGKLDSLVEEGGSNWSVGQRQLICLARAILRNSKLLMMDEATSSVDLKTDALIQNAIRSEQGLFSDSTVLTIAHRLNTVIDYDLIIVLNAGEIVESGSPFDLLSKDPNGEGAWFARMVSELGPDAISNMRHLTKKTRT